MFKYFNANNKLIFFFNLIFIKLLRIHLKINLFNLKNKIFIIFQK